MSETPTPSLLQDWLRGKANTPYFAAYRGDLLSIAHALDSLHSALTAERTARERAEANLLCPGQMRCAKCKFELTRRTLFVQSGTVGAGSSETEPCPNGCGPLWPVTWEQEARACYAAMDRLFDEKQRAEAERDALRAEVARLRSEVRAEVLEEVLRKLPAARDVNGETNDFAQGWRAGVVDCDAAIRAAKERS